MISYVDPDVMILHETIKSIDGFFEDTGIPQKDYNYMEAANEQEARVIYKKSAFEKVDPSPVNLDTVLKEVIPKKGNKSSEKWSSARQTDYKGSYLRCSPATHIYKA